MSRPVVLSTLFLSSLWVLGTPGEALAGPKVAADTFHWVHEANVKNWSKTYSFRVVGPATITLRHGMKPYDGRSYSNKFDQVFTHNLAPGVLKLVRSEELFDGKPFASFGVSSTRSLVRKVSVHSASTVWSLPAGSTFEGSVTVGAPGEQTGWWTQHGADAWFDVTLGNAASPETPPAPPGGIAGTYRLDANHYLGKLVVSAEGGKPTVKMFYDGYAQWEAISDAKFDPAAGELSFTRKVSGSTMVQYYRGKLSGTTLKGTFSSTDPPTDQYSWQATR